MTILVDDTDVATDGIAQMLRALLPPDQGYVLTTFNLGGGDLRITRSTNHRRELSVRRLRNAADLIEKRNK